MSEAPPETPAGPGPRAGANRKRLFLIARLVLVAVLVVALYRFVDWDQLAQVAAALSPFTIVGMLMCGSAARLVTSTRWRVLCGGLMAGPPRIRRLFRLGLFAEFVNIWVPSFIGGEVVRIWGLREYSTTVTATWSVGLDRVLGLAGLVLAVVPMAFLVDLPIPGWAYAVGLGAVAAGVALAMAVRPRLVGMGEWAAALAGLRTPRVLSALALSALSPWCLVMAYVLFFGDLLPSLGFGHIAAFVLLSRFGRAVPLQLFGLNSVEGSMWVIGALLDIPREILALSLATNFFDKLTHSLAGGVIETVMNGTEVLQRVMQAEPEQE